MSRELTIGQIVDHYENNDLIEITTQAQIDKGSVAFMDLVATKNTGKSVVYIFNRRSGLTYRKVGSHPGYALNRIQTKRGDFYARQFNRVRQMNNALPYIERYRER